jgi:hypothetical protein
MEDNDRRGLTFVVLLRAVESPVLEELRVGGALEEERRDFSGMGGVEGRSNMVECARLIEEEDGGGEHDDEERDDHLREGTGGRTAWS